ncbi:hypothetical protein PCASD_08701 [Puccinia coronata f. sp. avenae]|uniref:Retrotransposon gag domain-containing protein n=1 Tax=Puccinia coronata f. sp. avenae TaxID=200324 RepID=A0A2N5UG56_9BASI|nr:hypothetical protein PCASD_08701 [Puccinia coronata f. sp. avenae]
MPPEETPVGVEDQHCPATDACVKRLALDVARVEGALTEIMAMMRNSAMFNAPPPPEQAPQHPPPSEQPHYNQPGVCYQPHEAPHLRFDHPQQNTHPLPPPPPPHGPSGHYWAPGAPEFDHLARMEPIKIPDLWFSESRRIVWISCHFGYRPSDHKKHASPAENWYTSLVNDKARCQGNFSPYADLDSIKFTIPLLLLVEAFIKGLITVFGDRFMKENAKRALAACKQRDSTIGEYNSRFCSLVYLVEDVEAARIERYVSSLNPRIINKAMSKEWRAADTLEARMELAMEAAAQLDLLALLPLESSQTGRHQPLSLAPPPGLFLPPHHQSLIPVHDPNAMEIDATTTCPSNCPPTVFNISWSICCSKNLCFQCLKPLVPVTHTCSLNCLNALILLEQQELFVKRNC